MGKKALENLTESMFYVLMSFLRQARCGTEIAEWVRLRTRDPGASGPGDPIHHSGKI